MATFNVTNGNDFGTGSLRDAVFQANELPGTDTIFVETDVNLNSAIEITDSLYLGTPYGANITQSGSDRILIIDDRDLNKNIDVGLHRLNLVGGKAVDYGGGIYSSENLTLSDSQITGNSAEQAGGGVYQTKGSLDIIRSSIDQNQIESDDPLISMGGGIYLDNAESFTFANGSISDNNSIIGSGIAIRNTDSDIHNSLIDNNFDCGGIIDVSDSQMSMVSTTLQGNAQTTNYNIINDRNSEFIFEDVVVNTGFNYEVNNPSLPNG